MIGRNEIKEEISLVHHSQVLERYDPNDEIRGENSDISQELNLRNRSSEGDILPRHACSDGSTAVQEPMKSTLPPCHRVFNYLNLSLFGLVAMKYQGKSEDPFKANPAPSWSSLAAIVMHFLTSLILMQFHSRLTRFLSFLSRVAFVFGVVSSLSLISLLLPKLPGLLLICASWALFVVMSWWPILESAYGWLLTKIKTVTDVFISFARKLFSGPNINCQQERAEV